MKREQEIRKLLGKDYHLSIETDGKELKRWILFKKYKDTDVYFSKDNKPIMSSEENTEKELYEFAKKHHRLDSREVEDRVIRISLICVFILSIINIFIDGVLSEFVLISDFWLLIWMFVNHKIFINNWKVDMLELHENFQKRKKEISKQLKKVIEELNEDEQEEE